MEEAQLGAEEAGAFLTRGEDWVGDGTSRLSPQSPAASTCLNADCKPRDLGPRYEGRARPAAPPRAQREKRRLRGPLRTRAGLLGDWRLKTRILALLPRHGPSQPLRAQAVPSSQRPLAAAMELPRRPAGALGTSWTQPETVEGLRAPCSLSEEGRPSPKIQKGGVSHAL